MPNAKKSRKLDVNVARLMLGELERHHEGMHTKQQKTEAIYNLEWSWKAPYDMNVVVPSKAASIVDRAVHHIVTANVAMEVVADKETDAERKRAGKLSKAVRGIRELVNQSLEVTLERAITFDAVLRGAFDVKVLVNPNWKSLSDDDKRHTLPIIVRVVDPILCFPPPDARLPLSYHIEKQPRYVQDAWTRYPEWPDPHGAQLINDGKGEEAANPLRPVEWFEVFTPDQYLVVIDNAEAYNGENPYSLVPHIWGYSGLGRRRYDNSSEKLARGVLDKVTSELFWQVRLMTTLDAFFQYTVFPVLASGEEDPETLRGQFDGKPGSIIPGSIKEVGWLQKPQLGGEFFSAVASLDNAISEGSVSEVLGGERPTGIESGFHQALMTGQARLKLRTVVDQVEGKLGAVYTMILRMLRDNVLTEKDSTLTVYGTGSDGSVEEVAISRDDLKGNLRVRVKLEPNDPLENDRRLLTGLRMRAQREISKRLFLKDFVKHPDPDAELTQQLAEGVVEDIAPLLGRIALEDLEMDDVLGVLEDAEKVLKGEIDRRGKNAGQAALRAFSEIDTQVRKRDRLEAGQGGELGETREQGIGLT